MAWQVCRLPHVTGCLACSVMLWVHGNHYKCGSVLPTGSSQSISGCLLGGAVCRLSVLAPCCLEHCMLCERLFAFQRT